MDYWAKTKLIEWAAGNDPKSKLAEILRQEMQAQIEAFAGPEPSPIEQALAETAALSWFALRLYEATYVRSSKSESGLTIKQADFHLRRIDRAHHRLLTTLKTLATVRRLALPAVQINVASSKSINSIQGNNMKGKSSRLPTSLLARRPGWENLDQYGEWLAECIVERAIAGHFAFFKLLLDRVEGSIDRGRHDEQTIETGGLIVMLDDRRASGRPGAERVVA
jgi:hypothetical protein